MSSYIGQAQDGSEVERTISRAGVKLTRTEACIATLIYQKYSTKEIARRLSISPATVNVHRKHIRKKIFISHKISIR